MTYRSEILGELLACSRVGFLIDRVTELGAVPLGEIPNTVMLGRFELDRVLGCGTYGVVFAAHDRDLRRDVALKVFGAEADAVHEAQALARVHHPNVVVLYDIGHDNGFHYLILALVDGGTMSERISTGLDWRTAIDLFVQVGRGLAAVHWAGMTHGDVKPDNMLLGPEDRAYLADFGLAQTLIPGASRNSSARRGTLQYMAPECRGGLGIDARSDQFSFCVALAEALLGEPVAESSCVDTATLHARGVPTQLEQVICRGLAARPQDRFPDMAELLDALVTVQQGR